MFVVDVGTAVLPNQLTASPTLRSNTPTSAIKQSYDGRFGLEMMTVEKTFELVHQPVQTETELIHFKQLE